MYDKEIKRTPSMLFMNNFAIADLTMLLFRIISVDYGINSNGHGLNKTGWRYGKYLCYADLILELMVSGIFKVTSFGIQP